jgi:DNA-binding NarL/FixJ family response regulator
VTGSVDLDRGRAAYRRRAWGEARAALAAAEPLGPDDLEQLATAAFLMGRGDESVRAWERAFHARVAEGARDRAAYCAFRIAFEAFVSGAPARAAGWTARGQRILRPEDRACAVHGYLVIPTAIELIGAGDTDRALSVARDAAGLGERCGDTDLVAFARCVEGRALIRAGRVGEGVALLDEVMVAVIGDEVTPVLAGDLYCTVIEGCQEAYDLGRAQEWTEALTRWCEDQPDLVPYRGQCLVHRAEIMLLRGAWPDAADTARSAGERLAGHPAAGAAAYVEGELCRLRGAYAEAEAAYRRAGASGREPQPGLALLRLAQGRRDAASAAIRRAVDESEATARPPLLAAAVEIALAGEDVTAARAAAEELAGAAAARDAPILRAMAAEATGAVLAASGETAAALATLRRAWTAWHRLPAPYAAARVRVLIASACRAAGDEDSALMEQSAAADAFAALGAAPDLARLTSRRDAGGLTAREVEVLRLVAGGLSNRAVAADLVLSEKTVARHVSNILSKLGLPSRAAATAYAYEHGLTENYPRPPSPGGVFRPMRKDDRRP